MHWERVGGQLTLIAHLTHLTCASNGPSLRRTPGSRQWASGAAQSTSPFLLLLLAANMSAVVLPRHSVSSLALVQPMPSVLLSVFLHAFGSKLSTKIAFT